MDRPAQPPIGPAAAPTSPPAIVTAWPHSAQLTTAFLLGVAATLLFVHVMGSVRWGARPLDLERTTLAYRIDLNRATRAELLQVPGIGPALAERIDEHRQQQAFQSVDDLLKVRGIGPATLQRVRSWVCVGPDSDDEQPAPSVVRASGPSVDDGSSMKKEGGSAKSPTKKDTPLSAPIDINLATAEQLQRLSGIGPVLSERIIAERSKRPFKTVDELRRVGGIGPKTLERLRPSITVTPSAKEAAKDAVKESTLLADESR
jgi:competence protein ComEA